MKKLLTTREAAEFLRIQPQTLRVKRMKNEGPKFISIPNAGKRLTILYDMQDLLAYLGLIEEDKK